MKKNTLLKLYLVVFAVVLALVFSPVLNSPPALAEPNCSAIVNNTCPDGMPTIECMRCFAELTGVSAQLTDIDEPFPVIIGNIIRGLLGFLGIIFLILILYGGFLWMTSAGNEEQITKAKKIITNSAIGLFIIIVSFALTVFIFDIILKATVA